ncbi:MAG: hypothetical protein M5T61_09795 [Acidimicrobiia bacterium]|nr:hypothetical protein [Acidimicrobiia bacterium]
MAQNGMDMAFKSVNPRHQLHGLATLAMKQAAEWGSRSRRRFRPRRASSTVAT